MILRVPFEGFADAVRRCTSGEEAYVTNRNGLVWATAGEPGKGIIVAAAADVAPEEARKRLKDAGLMVHDGSWRESDSDASLEEGGQTHVAAVAYRSGEPSPGLWMDAFPSPVTQSQVLRAMYEEMVQNGEIDEVGFEEFVRVAEPNVVVLSPEEVAAYAAKNCESGDGED